MRWIVANRGWRKQPQAESRRASDSEPLGARGEAAAAGFLERLGYRIVARNVRAPIGRTRAGALVRGELDIVAFDGDTLVFVEVKTRTSDALAEPESAVTQSKRRRLIRTARRYRRLVGPFEAPFRFDVVGVVWRENLPPEIRLVKNFFRDGEGD